MNLPAQLMGKNKKKSAMKTYHYEISNTEEREKGLKISKWGKKITGKARGS